MFKDNEFLQQVLIYSGVPEGIFDYADPLAILFVFIFSSRIFIFLLSVFLWLFVVFIRGRMGRNPHGQGGGGMGGYDVSTHQYHDMNSMHKMYKVDKKPSFFWLVFKGFVFPVGIIYIAITIALGMVYGF